MGLSPMAQKCVKNWGEGERKRKKNKPEKCERKNKKDEKSKEHNEAKQYFLLTSKAAVCRNGARECQFLLCMLRTAAA